MKLIVRTSFEASHQLVAGVAEDSPCRRLHGHSYKVVVTLSGDDAAVEDGILVDADDVKDFIRGQFDHRHLNDVLGEWLNPTAEAVAMTLKKALQVLCVGKAVVESVFVQEGPDGVCVEV